MLDIKNFKEDEINFKNNRGNDLVFYKNNKIQFYLKNSRTVTEITEYNGKKNILVKIEDEYTNFFEKLEKKYIEEYGIEKKNFISLLKKNDKGTIIKLKVNYNKYKKTYINIYDENKEEITEDDLEKDCNVDCVIEIDRFWNFNGKTGYIVLVKKINKKYMKKN